MSETEKLIAKLDAEIARLKAQNAELLAELENIAKANPRKWDEMGDDFEGWAKNDFEGWAKNRARAAIAKAKE